MAADEDAAAARAVWDDPTSAIHTIEWKQQMKRLCSGETPNIDKIYVVRPLPRSSSVRAFMPRHGFNLLQDAALQSDVPAMAQILMRGADIEFGADLGFSPLAMALSSLATSKGDRSLLAAVKRAVGFLLAVGANPNARYAVKATDDPVLMLAVFAAANFGDWGFVEMLLRHGADPDARSGSTRDTAASLLPRTEAAQQRWQRLAQQYRGQPRPPWRCPCGSGDLYVECHAEPHERSDGKRGKAADPEWFCPCRSGRKYARCCQKHGIVYFETLSNTYEQRTVALPPVARGVMQQMMEMQRQRQQNGGPLTGRMFPDILDAEGRPVNTLMHAKAAVLEPLRQAGLLDPAFYYAAIKVDFVLKGYWPEGLLPKNEMRKRMEEVNAAVDEYIALGTDPRPALEIERAAKVAADGGPLYRRCAACGRYEEAHGQYKTCSSCKAVRYCGADCQASHWKAGHKRACKSGPAKEVCRSQLAYSLAAEAVAMGIMGPPLALYVQQKLADMERAAAGEAAGSGAAAAAPAAGTSGE